MSEKRKIEKNCIGSCEGKSLVVKLDIIFLSYLVEKVFLNFVFKRI